MICPNCQAENPDSARYCLNCGVALAKHCPNCQADLPPGARYCMQCGQSLRTSTADDVDRHTRLASTAPSSLIDKVRAASDLSGERRVVTVLHVDVVGSTALSEQLDLETWTTVINGAFDRIAPIIYLYEGTIAHLVGDALLAFFGAPVAHEDDPMRAVRAALDLMAVAGDYAEFVRQEYGVEFAIRACLNTGPVIMGSVSDDLKYEYNPVGGVVNLATRLKFAAEPMTVLISENTHRFVEPLFDCVDLGAIEVKGRPEPVHAYQVIGRKAEPDQVRGLAGLESPMVGRDAELASLIQLCETVRAGLGRAVLIIGEPGLGKTRLIAEWKAAVNGIGHEPSTQWAEGHGLSYGQGLAYHLIIDLLHSLTGIPTGAEEPEICFLLQSLTEDLFGDSAIEVYPYLCHLLSLQLEGQALEQVRPLDPQALQAHYLTSLRRLLKVLAIDHPLVIILEDLHWADPSSIEMLTKLLPLASEAPILFCLVTRPEQDTPGWKLVTTAREILSGGLTEMNIEALSDLDSRKLVSNLLEIEALPDDVRTHILHKAEGNPFFVEEVIRMLIDRGAIIQENGNWVAGAQIEEVDIPDNLQSLLLARIDRLPDEVKHTLRVAAVIGRQFPLRVLERVLVGEDTA
jgi:class 3 adenylate cyclase